MFARSAEPRILIVVGGFFILLAIFTAMGAVSLGVLQRQYPVPFNAPYSSGSYLVDSPLFEFLAVVFAGLGGYFLYCAGKLKGAHREPTITVAATP